ncbi:MAG TPA: NAD(P)H-dependent oxidoreductase subunit E [Solirubrobacteraceae bacterium]|nr:NAD(P)H-dependent oxidoreductase subunit E [Solirubrobacteraceae bacterium]
MSFRDRRSPDLTGDLQQRRGEGLRDPGNARFPVPRFGHGSRVPGWDEAVDLTKDPAVIPDLATTPVPEDLRREIEVSMAKYPDRRSAVMAALHAAQAVYGWCSPRAIDQVAAVMRLTPAYVTSVASFYDMYKLTPKPANDVFVCTNISCSLLGADEFQEAMSEAAQGEDINVASFECLGACDIAPMASVNGEYVGPLQTEDAQQIVDDLRAGRPVLAAKQLRYRRSVDAEPAHPDAEGPEFAPPADAPRADTAGLTGIEARTDRPGEEGAPVEIPPETRDDA